MLVENDGLPEGSVLLAEGTQLPVSSQNMVEMGKKLLQAASENDVDSVRSLMANGAPFTGNWVSNFSFKCFQTLLSIQRYCARELTELVCFQLGTTPLHAAAKAGHIDTVELLLKAGIFRDARTKVERTALQMAAEEGHTAIVQVLIDHGADINNKDMLKMTALHWAAQHSHHDIVELLLRRGADVTLQNKFGKSPLDIACDNGSESIIQLLQVKIVYVSRAANKLATCVVEWWYNFIFHLYFTFFMFHI